MMTKQTIGDGKCGLYARRISNNGWVIVAYDDDREIWVEYPLPMPYSAACRAVRESRAEAAEAARSRA